MFRKFQQFLTSLTALADLTPQPFRRQWLSLVLLFTIFGLTPFSWGELVPVDITVHDSDSDNGAFYYQAPIQSDPATEAQGPCSGQDCRPESVGDFVGNLKGAAKAIKDASVKTRDDAARAAIRLRYAPYSLHPKTLAMIALGWKKPGYEKQDPGVEGNCFKSVKEMLFKSGFIARDEWKEWRDGMAKNAGPGLEAIGFENIFDPDSPYPFRSCADAPIGAFCVYAPIDPNARRCYRSGCVEAAGHIELNLETKFPAQYSGNNPYTGKDSLKNKEYKLIGIYVNPNPNPLGGRRH